MAVRTLCWLPLLIPTLLTAAYGCKGDEHAHSATDAPSDVTAATCDVSQIPAFQLLPPSALVTQQIPPSITQHVGETINDVLQGRMKLHYLVAPAAGRPLRDELFLWLGGSGTNPDNYRQLLNIAALAGYASVSLAYDNETSIGNLCGSMTDPVCNDVTTPSCEGTLRAEMVYGNATSNSPCHDVPVADSIEHRLLRLLQHLATNAPQTRAASFLTPDRSAILWSKIVVGGWSQGGGHAGMISRDHVVARAIFVSKGAGSTVCSSVTPNTADCDLDGDGVITPGNRDELLVPTLWARDARMTPPEREFGIVHEDEEAWFYTREAFERWGMGAKASAMRVDGIGADYAKLGCAHSLTTNHTVPPPCAPDEYHSSMAADLCVPLDTMGPAYLYMLTVPVP